MWFMGTHRVEGITRQVESTRSVDFDFDLDVDFYLDLTLTKVDPYRVMKCGMGSKGVVPCKGLGPIWKIRSLMGFHGFYSLGLDRSRVKQSFCPM